MGDIAKMQELSLDSDSTRDTASISPKETSNRGDIPSVYLVETFYITSKKNTVFQVRLTEKGLSLRKESNGSSKEQTILVQDIIGCRCLRSKRKRNATSACACSTLPGQQNLRVVEDNSVDLDETDISAYLYIYAYILKKNRRGGRRERTTITLRFRSFDKYDDNNKEAQKWRAAIKQLVGDEERTTTANLTELSVINFNYTMEDNRKVLILLNPKSGSGKARETFQQRVAPIFVEAEIAYDLQVTKYANYAREFVRSKDVFGWKYIVVVGGDGIFYEVINGLFERPDWERAVDEIGIGIIPCGSGNGLARTIAHIYNEPYDPKPILGAALTVVRGKPTLMDLVRIETRSQTMFSFLSAGWGIISDIDIESERLRIIGYQRFNLWSLHRIISLRTYHGTVSYMPATIYNSPDEQQQNQQNALRSHQAFKSQMRHSMSCGTQLDCSECNGEGDCEACDTGFGDVLSLETSNGIPLSPGGGGGGGGVGGAYRPRLDSWYSANSRKSAYYSTADSLYQSVAERMSSCGGSQSGEFKMPAQMYGPAPTIPALTAPVPDSWTTETGEYIMVHATYLTHLSSDIMFAPSAQLNDGIIWLCIVRAGASRQDLLKFMLGLSTGTHITNTQHQYIQMVPVTAFRIEPKLDGSNEQAHGHFTVDGERVEYGPIQGEVVPGLARVMAPIYTS